MTEEEGLRMTEEERLRMAYWKGLERYLFYVFWSLVLQVLGLFRIYDLEIRI